MFQKITRIYFLLISAILLGACDNIQDIVDDAHQALTREQASYRYMAEIVQREENTAIYLEALSNWQSQLKLLNATLARIVGEVRANPDDRGSVENDLQALKRTLEDIFQRTLDASITVPSWEHQQANTAVGSVYGELGSMKDNYRKLYGPYASEIGIILTVTVDQRYYDTYPDCVSLFTTSFMLDPYKEYCLKEASQRCGHQMDLDCVQSRILQNVIGDILGEASGTTPSVSSCVNVRIEEGGDEDGDMYQEEHITTRAWLLNIDSCRSSIPVYRN